MQPDPTKEFDDDSINPVDAIIAEYLLAAERGEKPDRAQILAKHPEHARQLADYFADMDRIDQALPATSMADTVLHQSIQLKSGSMIAGRYKLIENIGEGGMGSVWVAEQKEPVKRKVAVKLVKAGMDSKQVLARFEAERQALAMMDHPNIAKVFDGGMTEQGRPFFVMEYVKGIPFTQYCDQARLSLKQRLELFIPVCQAVQHAHHKGIVHRDLKPSNILICLYDGKPVPKVIDFGLAKAMNQQLTEQSIFTGHGVMVGTPVYMSPEQAELNNLDIDTRTDIYSLGVVLYELLTGTTPLEREQLRTAAYAEILRLIKEVEPPRPSTKLSGSASLPSVAAQRNIDPRSLQKSLAGDLDWIVMKSLEKERTRRYETATGLQRDIERFLNDEAVEACPPSRLYQLRKFVRKHRGAVMATTTIFMALFLGVVGTSVGFWRAIATQNDLQATIDFAKSSMEEVLVKTSPEVIENASSMKTTISPPYGPPMQFRIEVDRSSGESRVRVMPVDDNDELNFTRCMIWWMSNSAMESFDSKNEALAEKTAALTAEATARDLAERQLIEGLLRPIGFHNGEYDINEGELRCFVDWAAIRDNRLKLRVLEVAFEDPETALCIARRADRVAQACVALSPIRRKQAIEFLSAQQRRTDADPRIRIAAVWLALELGSSDLVALPDALTWLSRRDFSRYLRREFSEFAQTLSSRAKSLKREQVLHIWTVMISELEKSEYEWVWHDVAIALAPQLSTEQIVRLLDGIIFELQKSQYDYGRMKAGEVLVGLAPHLSSKQLIRARDSLISVLQSTEGPKQLYFAARCLIELSKERPATAVVEQLAVGLVARLENFSHPIADNAEALATLAPMVDRSHISRAVDLLIASIPSADHSALYDIEKSLEKLVPHLLPSDALRSTNVLLRQIRTSRFDWNRKVAGKAILGLSTRIEPEHVSSVFDATFEVLDHLREVENNSWAAVPLGRALGVWAAKLNALDMSRKLETFITFFEQTGDDGLSEGASTILSQLAPGLDPVAFGRTCDIVLTTLQNSDDRRRVRDSARTLAALAPRLEKAVIPSTVEILRIRLEKADDDETILAIGNTLARLAPRATQRVSEVVEASFKAAGNRSVYNQGNDDFSLPRVNLLFEIASQCEEWLSSDFRDELQSQSIEYLSIAADVPTTLELHLAFLKSRDTAGLLKHPDLVAYERDIVLQRFEELVLHDGRRVFPPRANKNDRVDSTTPAAVFDTAPPRRLLTINDAAKWIEQNWPDFDLEAPHPLKWRGER